MEGGSTSAQASKGHVGKLDFAQGIIIPSAPLGSPSFPSTLLRFPTLTRQYPFLYLYTNICIMPQQTIE